MVLAFFMHTVSPLPLSILYSQIFEGNRTCNRTTKEQKDNDDQPQTNCREIRRESILQAACQIQSEYELAERCSVVCENPAEYVADAVVVSGERQGLLAVSDAFFSAAVVLWQSSCSVVYAFVLNPNENRILARSVLKLLMAQLNSQAPIVFQPKETLLKLDKIQAVVNHFIPSGQLLFMTHRIVRQFEKELEKYNKN